MAPGEEINCYQSIDKGGDMTEREYCNCPECGYSAYPNEILGKERKHHWPHSLECVRCGYRTETKNSWDEAKRSWNRAGIDRRAHVA